MKISKAQSILRIYSVLLKNKAIEKDKLVEELSLSDMTWNRYLTEIRSYLDSYEDRYELVYRRANNNYVLKEKNGK